MILIALALVLLGVVLGGAGMRRMKGFRLGAWRPGAGVIAVICLFAGAALAARAQWPESALLLALGLGLALSARKRPAAQPVVEGMSDAQARALLGVPPDADADAIREAYHRLMRRVHPDQGGAVGLAAQLNAARDRLKS